MFNDAVDMAVYVPKWYKANYVQLIYIHGWFVWEYLAGKSLRPVLEICRSYEVV